MIAIGLLIIWVQLVWLHEIILKKNYLITILKNRLIFIFYMPKILGHFKYSLINLLTNMYLFNWIK